ncbi:hypothetical protein Taro_022205 [Colocasia esculenta]|uniref:Uncharacterized protein n=1 Tax=Colocasia esculenta TaxID=4460 RepID=A0A843V391_COLES|nr:hypothetical protein [Colocasia esculenta]
MGDEHLPPWAIASLVGLLSLLFFRRLFHYYSSSHRRKLKLPPSPTALPILGHLHLLAPLPHQALHRLSTRLGPLMHLRLGSVPCVVASDAGTAQEFLRTHELSFSDRPGSISISCLTYGGADFSFAPYGDYWTFMKKLCMSELLGGRTLEQLRPVRREEIGRFLGTLRERADRGEEVDLGSELKKLTNNVICRMAMGRRCSGTDGEAEQARKLVEETAELSGGFNAADFIWFFRGLDLQGFRKRSEDVNRRFDSMMEGILREKEEARRKNMGEETTFTATDGDGDAKDLVDLLLDIAENEDATIRLTRDNIKAFVLDIFAAGTDSSAITTEWAMAELINHPAILHRAREEIDTVVGRSRLVDESDVPNLPYLQAVVKETLRLHPAGPLNVRQSTRDCRVGGYDVPAGTRLFVNTWAIGRDPAQWAEPLQFRPERFGEGGDGAGVDVRGQHFRLLPFGSGRRVCPGASLALHVVQGALAAMVQCFEWKVEGGRVDMAEGAGLTLPRARPLFCQPVARLDPLPVAVGRD